MTHYNIVSLQAQTVSFWPIFEEGKEVVIAFLPFFHIYGQVVVMLNGLVQGSTLVLFTTPDVDDILSAMERYQASGFYGVPTLFEYLKDYEKTDRVNWKRLKLIACGADTLHESTIKDWERRTGTKILEGYGMTETTAVSHSTPYDRPKTGSFGVPIPGVTAAVVDIDRHGIHARGRGGGIDPPRPQYYAGLLEETRGDQGVDYRHRRKEVAQNRGSGQNG